MFDEPTTAERPVDAADLSRVLVLLSEVGTDTDDAELVERISVLERIKAAAAAAQARVTAAFVTSQRLAQRAAGVPAKRWDEGISAQVALARRESPARAARYTGWATVLVGELPHTFAALQSGETTEWRAMIVARETIWLSRADRATVDAELADRLPGLGDRHVEAEARKIAYRLDPAGFVARSRAAANDRRVSLRPAPDTMSRLTALLPAAQGVAAYHALVRAAEAARAAGDLRGRGQVMADTLVERLTGQAAADRVPVRIDLVMTDQTLFGDDPHAARDGYTRRHGDSAAIGEKDSSTHKSRPNAHRDERGDDRDDVGDDVGDDVSDDVSGDDRDDVSDDDGGDVGDDAIDDVSGDDRDNVSGDDRDDVNRDTAGDTGNGSRDGDADSSTEDDRGDAPAHTYRHDGDADPARPHSSGRPSEVRDLDGGSDDDTNVTADDYARPGSCPDDVDRATRRRSGGSGPEERPRRSDEPAYLVGYGPIPAGIARDLARAKSADAWVRRLYLNPTTGDLAAMDSRARVFPARIRDALIIRDQVCRTLWCGAPIRHADHARTFADGGETSLPNGQGLCEACNYAKQAPGWRTAPTAEGTGEAVTTTTPTGHTYLSRPPGLPGSPPPEAAAPTPSTPLHGASPYLSVADDQAA